jgi:hypothetical protein
MSDRDLDHWDGMLFDQNTVSFDMRFYEFNRREPRRESVGQSEIYGMFL